MILGDLAVRILGDTKQLEKDVEATGTSPKIAGAGTAAGALFSKAARAGILTIGPAAGIAFASGVDAAAQFADQLATIKTVATDISDSDLAKIGDQALALSAKTGKPIEDLTQGLYDLVSAGIPANDAVQVLTASSNLAIGGLGSTAQAVDAVTSAMNAYGPGVYNATQVTDIFAKAVADGKVTAAELGDSISTIAPIAAQAGISLEEVSAGYAVMTAKGVPAAEAATQMRSAIVALISPNAVLNTIQARTGTNFAKLAKEKGLSVALQQLRQDTDDTAKAFAKFQGPAEDVFKRLAAGKIKGDEAAKALANIGENLGLTEGGAKNLITAVGKQGLASAFADLRTNVGAGDEGLANALGRVEALNFTLASTGPNFDAFQSQVGDSFNSAGLAAEQASIKMDSPVEAGKRLAAQFHAMEVKTFGPFAQSFGPAVVGLNQLGGAMSSLIRPASLVFGVIGQVVSLIAALATGLLTSAPEVAAAGEAVGAAGAAGVATAAPEAAAAGAVEGEAAATGLAATAPEAAAAGEVVGEAAAGGISLGAVLLPALLIAAIGAAIVLVVNDPSLVGKAIDAGAGIVGAIADGVSQFAGKLGDRIGEVIATVGPIVTSALGKVGDAIQAFVKNLPARVGEVVKNVGPLILPAVRALGQIVRDFLGQVPGIVADLAPKIVGAFVQIAGLAIGAFATLVTSVGDWGPPFLAAVAGVIFAIPGFVADAITNIIAAFLGLPDGTSAGFGGVVDGAVNMIAGVLAAIVNGVLGLPGTLIGALVGAFSAAFQAVVDLGPGFLLQVTGFILSIPFRILDLQVKLLEFFTGIWTNILGGVAQLIANIVGFVLALPGRIASVAPAVLGMFVTLGQNIVGAVSAFLLTVAGVFVGMPARIFGLVATIAGYFGDLGRRLVSGVQTFVGNIVDFFLRLPGRIVSVGGAIVTAIVNGLSGLPGRIAGVISDAFRGLNINVGPFHISGSGVTIDLPHIDFPHFAAGVTNFAGGPALIGEKGPEILNLPAGANVTSNRDFVSMLGQGAGSTLHIEQVNLNGIGNDVSPLAAQTFAQEILDVVAAGFRDQTVRTAEG